MKYLLDTHTFLCALFDTKKLSPAVIEIMQQEENEEFVSVISFWEISLKYNLGKISFKGITPEDLPVHAEKGGYSILSVSPLEAASFHKLPQKVHKDPFDRFIIWQAIRNDMILSSHDVQLRQYRSIGLHIEW